MSAAQSASSGVRFARSTDLAITRWVGFWVERQHYALDIARVQEVLASVEIEPVPGAPPAVIGVINLRGRIITAVDLRPCLGFAGRLADSSCCVIVIEVHGETLGLCVDGVAEICSVARDAIRQCPPTLGRDPDPMVRGMVSHKGQLLTLLDAEQLARAASGQ